MKLPWVKYMKNSKSSIFFSNRKSLHSAVFYDAANGCVIPSVLIDFVNLLFLYGLRKTQPWHKELNLRDVSSDSSIPLIVDAWGCLYEPEYTKKGSLQIEIQLAVSLYMG